VLIKTATLTRSALDWAVAHCQNKVNAGVYGEAVVIEQKLHLHYCDVVLDSTYDPSTDWSQGGPIIEREGIEVVRGNNLYFPKGNEKGDHYESLWLARLPLMDLEHGYTLHGPTPLIAAMRCFVASKLGDEVDVPDKLMKTT